MPGVELGITSRTDNAKNVPKIPGEGKVDTTGVD